MSLPGGQLAWWRVVSQLPLQSACLGGLRRSKMCGTGALMRTCFQLQSSAHSLPARVPAAVGELRACVDDDLFCLCFENQDLNVIVADRGVLSRPSLCVPRPVGCGDGFGSPCCPGEARGRRQLVSMPCTVALIALAALRLPLSQLIAAGRSCFIPHGALTTTPATCQSPPPLQPPTRPGPSHNLPIAMHSMTRRCV